MRNLLITIILSLLSFQISFSQIKTVRGDTTYSFKKNKDFRRELALKDFEKSTDDFNFRFQTYKQIIEVSNDSTGINANITNYIYHAKRANKYKSETLSSKITLTTEQAKNAYNIIINSGILNLESDNKIKDWKKGTDGINYIIEHSDKKTYWLKSYWTPSAQGGLPEAITVLHFEEEISEALDLPKIYTVFRNDLPKSGCYDWGGMVTTCYTSKFLVVGYSGSTKLPFGLYTSYSASSIGKTEVNSAIALQYNFDKNGFRHLNLLASKWNIFIKKSTFSDFITYNYQKRKLDIDQKNNKFHNYQIKYGLNLKNSFGLGAGLDYMTNGEKKIGPHLYGSKWFSTPDITTTLTSSFFNDQINYKAEIFKSFKLNAKFFTRRITLGLAYEDFMDYKDLYLRVQVLL